jgi:hypothetical protein
VEYSCLLAQLISNQSTSRLSRYCLLAGTRNKLILHIDLEDISGERITARFETVYPA